MSLVLLDGDDETGAAPPSNPDFIIPVTSRRRRGVRVRRGATWTVVPAQVTTPNPAIIFRYGTRSRRGMVPRRGHYWVPTPNQTASTVAPSFIEPIRQSHRVAAPSRRRLHQPFSLHIAQTFQSPLIVTLVLGVSGSVNMTLSTAADVTMVLDTAAEVTIDITSLNYEP